MTINFYIRGINCHAIPFAVGNLNSRRIADLNRVVNWLLFFIMLGRIYINTTHIRLIKTGDNNLRVIGYIHVTRLIQEHAVTFATLTYSIQNKRRIIKRQNTIIKKISRIATMNRIVRNAFFNNLNILECHIGLVKVHAQTIQGNRRFSAFRTLNRQITFSVDSQTVSTNGNILTDFNRIAVVSLSNRFLEAAILLLTVNLSRELCRRRCNRRIIVARAAYFALLLISCGCIVTAAVAVVSGFLYILGVTAAGVSGFLCILGAAVFCNIYIVILSRLTVFTVAYHVYNIIRGVGCSIAVRAFLRRKRGNRQHGQHHQSGEGTGKKTVISLFHAKNLLCVHTDAKEA